MEHAPPDIVEEVADILIGAVELSEHIDVYKRQITSFVTAGQDIFCKR